MIQSQQGITFEENQMEHIGYLLIVNDSQWNYQKIANMIVDAIVIVTAEDI